MLTNVVFKKKRELVQFKKKKLPRSEKFQNIFVCLCVCARGVGSCSSNSSNNINNRQLVGGVRHQIQKKKMLKIKPVYAVGAFSPKTSTNTDKQTQKETPTKVVKLPTTTTTTSLFLPPTRTVPRCSVSLHN